MPRAAVEVHPQAADEAAAALRWYRERSESAADRFLAELERAVELISEAPSRWPPYVGNTRRFLLQRFPFFVVYVYRERNNQIEVLAVAHARRRPGYWQGR